MVYDPTYTDINDHNFKECDWESFYGNLRRQYPLMPQYRVVKKLTYECSYILTIQETDWLANSVLGTSFIYIWHPSSGFQIRSLQ